MKKTIMLSLICLGINISFGQPCQMNDDADFKLFVEHIDQYSPEIQETLKVLLSEAGKQSADPVHFLLNAQSFAYTGVQGAPWHLFNKEHRIKDLYPFRYLTKLLGLSLVFNEIRDLSSLVYLTDLQCLDLRFNPIVDFRPLAQLKKLKMLWLNKEQIELLPKNFLSGVAIIEVNTCSELAGLALAKTCKYILPTACYYGCGFPNPIYC